MKNAEYQINENDVIVFVIKCLVFCKQTIVWFLHRLGLLFYEVFKVLSTPMGKLSYDDKQRIQMFREQGLGAKAIISSYPGHKGWKLSFVKKICSWVDSTGQ